MTPARNKKQRPFNAAATRQPTALSVFSRPKGFFLHPHAFFFAWCIGDVSQSPTVFFYSPRGVVHAFSVGDELELVVILTRML